MIKLSISKTSMTVKKNGVVLERLPALTFNLLYYFAIHKDEVLSREKIIKDVWTVNFVGTRTIDVHVTKLRKLIDPPNTSSEDSAFQSILGVGYKFVGLIQVDDEIKNTDVEIKHGIKMGYPYKIDKKSNVILIPLFISESKYGDLVTYSRYGKFYSVPVNEFTSSFVEV